MAKFNERPGRDNAGEGRRGTDRNRSDRPNNDREGKKIFNRRDKYERSGDEGEGRGERRSFGDRQERRDNDRKPFNAERREGGERRSYGDRREGGERRSFNADRREGGERRSYNSDRREGGERRSFGSDRPNREGGERRPYGDRREGGERGERRSFNSDRPERRDNDRRSFNSDRRDDRRGGERRSFNSDRREGGEHRSFNSDRPRREDGERRSFNSDRRDDRRGGEERGERRFNRDGKLSFGEKRSFREDRGGREVRSFSSSRGRSSDRFNRNEEPQQAPDYNLSRYKNNPRIKKSNREEEENDGTIRLNRYIANAGVCSRREADVLIESGEIRVNGEVITEMGYKVQPTDNVYYGKKLLSREKMVYVLLNKPKDFLTTTDDPEGRKTVMSLVGNASKERIFPVGRLDRNTTGLLLFTNDGEVAQKLTHPSNNIKKIYQVELDKPITKADFVKVAEGVELEDGKAEVDDVALLGESNKFLGLEIHIGRNRIVRRIFEHLGYEVVSLDRVQYAGLTKKDLPRGDWRYLTEKEVIQLKYFM
ncbi:pseudouridine synthase [Pontibacter chinhatensis]|uniref:Pseudouridine synthase n=1 Tax=Pontibacter chinhatensis TaxID=1436961 RepID=A0A1I2TS91_9BACT|nr:pseudouridine synthase [Pontibacter chinhatensis]SFG66227.1 23S rRNA pseudouridine2605 synthase [Pontibacter chinhatensis]